MVTQMTKHYKSRHADERQKEVYTKFPATSFLGVEENMNHVLLWNTFFRRNLHRFVIDFLGINLHLYQAILLYLMGISQFIVVIACRAAAKSFIIALYACCRCILYPKTSIVIASGTKGQAKLIVTKKIEGELMNMSPMLRRNISNIKDNQNEVVVNFTNMSTITVVAANDNARGNRSTCAIREEFRQIDKKIEDGVISPFQVIRQAGYMLDPFYSSMKELQEDPIDIYISSSWIDNGDHWMWGIVDQAYNGMINDDPAFCLLAFDESITIKHNIKTLKQLMRERKKQDNLTWRTEFLNERVKEDETAYFTYSMLQRNQRLKKPFYPRLDSTVRGSKRNLHDIPKQTGEVRIIACDMAFVENKRNDNSIFSCIRALPEYSSYKTRNTDSVNISNGYRRIVPYIESVQGGDVVKQAIRIRQLFEDFHADYIVLDTRNSGIAVYDILARVMYDEDRDCEYSPLSCMNDENIANRVKAEGANPCIFAVNASTRLNSDIAKAFRLVLTDEKIDLLVSYELASEEILPKIEEYISTPDGNIQAFYEAPFFETQALISETTCLVYEKNVQTGAITIRERGSNRKDRYTSVSYGSYFIGLLENNLVSNADEYEYVTLIN